MPLCERLRALIMSAIAQIVWELAEEARGGKCLFHEPWLGKEAELTSVLEKLLRVTDWRPFPGVQLQKVISIAMLSESNTYYSNRNI